MIDFIVKNHLGALASVIGLVITLIGFIIIRRNVLKTKNISKRIRKDISLYSSVVDFTAALTTMEDIKAFNRTKAWVILPTKYSFLRSTLIAVRESNPDMPDENKNIIQRAITSLSSTEHIIEQTIQHNTPPPDIARLNKNISSHIDKLRPILTNLSNQVGR